MNGVMKIEEPKYKGRLRLRELALQPRGTATNRYELYLLRFWLICIELPHSQLHSNKINAHFVICHDAHEWV